MHYLGNFETCFYCNYIEILYNEIGEDMVNVFHAMPCRKQFLHKFQEGR